MSNASDLKHHIPDQILMAYSAGSLPEAYSLVVACHLSLCLACRAQAESFDVVGGTLLDTARITAVSDDSFAQTMKRIKAGAPEAPAKRPLGDAILPQPLTDYVGGGVDAIRWKTIGGGVRQSVLKTDAEATARLLYIPAGMEMPDHGHKGLEMTMVLQGAFSDEGDRFARGDVEIGDEDLEHTPIAEAGADCICLAATDAPLKFKGLLPRLAQPFLGI